MRLAYYLLYAQIDDEDTIVYLFQEELKDRKSNSFQGIGNTLNVLTAILKQYNNDGKYNGMLEDAKNANFDCACGYDKNYQINDDIECLELLDCIDYDLTSGSELVDMCLQMKFLYTADGGMKSVFVGIDPR